VAAALASFLSGLRAERMSNTVVEATARIFDFITAIQDYSYMDQTPIQEIHVGAALDNVLAMFASRLNHVEVVREIAPVLPPISAYGSELNQVFSELIENALDAMHDNGTLTLRAKVSGPVVFVEVCDSGPGIPKEHFSRIFEPFFSTKNNGGVGTGLGLGLDQANRIVLKHSGLLTVTSEPGNTCFQVRLPIEPVGAY
jgi:signal transduction histidine kinase